MEYDIRWEEVDDVGYAKAARYSDAIILYHALVQMPCVLRVKIWFGPRLVRSSSDDSNKASSN